MEERRRIALGMAGGAAWAVGLLATGGLAVELPVFTLMPTIMVAFFAPGLVMLALVGRVGQRRFGGDAGPDGGPWDAAEEIDRRVLRDTVEQLVLALAIWPAAAVMLGAKGPGVIVTLGMGFALARLAFWLGSHKAPAWRAFGFGATFFPTCLVALWALWAVAT